jgi:hypothetical protein
LVRFQADSNRHADEAVIHLKLEGLRPSPKAFLLITLAGSFFVDLANAFIVKAFLALPGFIEAAVRARRRSAAAFP